MAGLQSVKMIAGDCESINDHNDLFEIIYFIKSMPGKTSDQFHPGLPNLSTLCWLPGKLNPFQTNFKFWVQFWATFNKHLIMMRSQRDIVENTSPPQ